MKAMLEEAETTLMISIPITVFVIGLAVVYNRNNKKLKSLISSEELDELMDTYDPEPLVLTSGEDLYIEPVIREFPVFEGKSFSTPQNLIVYNYMNFQNSAKAKDVATDRVKRNGVGSCGPRGFYGTVDVHLELEDRISKFMGLEETVLYSYSLSTMSSAIIAYCKKGDILFCDEKVSEPSIQGVQTAKGEIVYFRHNDVAHLEEKLAELDNRERDMKNKSRRFLLVEGIYYETGTLCPLPRLMDLRKRYMLRMFLDEGISFGTMGKHGRGVTEHFGVDRTDIDVIVGSLEHGIASIGGFCVGSSYVMEHQRLSGLGYCFSASLPPCLSSTAMYAIDFFQDHPEALEKLHKICMTTHAALMADKNIIVISSSLSPKKVLKPVDGNVIKIIDYCQQRGLLLDMNGDKICFNLNRDMDDAYISKLCSIINEATRQP